MDISDIDFEIMINQAMDELPQQYIERLDNVAITFDDEPSQEQRVSLKLRCSESLYGLYEGVPLTKRGNGFSGMLPDKITIFKNPIVAGADSLAYIKAQVKHTLWHEIAHYYGLDHDRIHELEQKKKVV